MNSFKLLFFQFFNSPVALKNKKKFGLPKIKLKWRPWKIVAWKTRETTWETKQNKVVPEKLPVDNSGAYYRKLFFFT